MQIFRPVSMVRFSTWKQDEPVPARAVPALAAAAMNSCVIASAIVVQLHSPPALLLMRSAPTGASCFIGRPLAEADRVVVQVASAELHRLHNYSSSTPIEPRRKQVRDV